MAISAAIVFMKQRIIIVEKVEQLFINEDCFFDRAEIIREKGTNRARFFRGEVDKYSWVDLGSSYLPSEFNAAFLFAQLEKADEINDFRLECWSVYYKSIITS